MILLPVASFLQESSWAFPSLEILHILSFCTLVGTAGVLDARLLGVSFGGRNARELCRETLPWTWAAFGGAVLTGGLLFCAQPGAYLATEVFRVKLALLAAAGINQAAFHGRILSRGAVWDGEGRPPVEARAAAWISLACWIGAVVCGRWIGYAMDPQ